MWFDDVILDDTDDELDRLLDKTRENLNHNKTAPTLQYVTVSTAYTHTKEDK